MKKLFFLLVLILVPLCVLCACNEETPEASVPICQHRDTDDNALCDKCNESYTDGIDVLPPETAEPHTHVWGEWTETASPTCTTSGTKTRTCPCGEVQTESVPSSGHLPSDTWSCDESSHWKTCTRPDCRAELSKTTHVIALDRGSDSLYHWEICTQAGCNVILNKALHTPASDWTSDGAYHWKPCTQQGCRAEIRKAAHAPASTWTSDGSHHWQACTQAGCLVELNKAPHIPLSELAGDDTHHWRPCAQTGCTEKLCQATHTYGDPQQVGSSTCTAGAQSYRICGACLYQKFEGTVTPPGHLPAVAWSKDTTHHWKVCTRTGCNELLSRAPHSFDGENSCTVCLYHSDVDPGIVFTLQGGTYAVTDYTGAADAVVIPATYLGAAVTEIGEGAFADCDTLLLVHLPAGITAIRASAFAGCDNLKDIILAAESMLATIGEGAFLNCSSLKSVIVPNSVTEIGLSAFEGCSALESITLPFVGKTPNDAKKTHLGNIFGADSRMGNQKRVPTSLQTVVISGGTAIPDNAFYGCSSLTSITIPTGTESIGFYAFHHCDELLTFTIPENVVTIGEWAFSSCAKLTSISIPAAVTDIGIYGFAYCKALTTVTFAPNAQLTSLRDNLFMDCEKLDGIVLPAGLTKISYSVFENCTSLSAITIPASVANIGTYAFRGCTKLASVSFEDPTGWWTAIYFDMPPETPIPTSDLSDTGTAATSLTKTYCSDYLKRI